MVPAVRESWDSNWMDGSLHSNCSKDEVLDDADVHAFGSALEPLPTWDAVGRDVHDDDHLRSYHDTAARQSRHVCVCYSITYHIITDDLRDEVVGICKAQRTRDRCNVRAGCETKVCGLI